MSSRLYPNALSALLDGSLDWTTATLKALLLSDAFSYNASQDKLSQIPNGQIIATSEQMTNPRYTDGLANGDPFEWLQVADAREVNSIVIFDDSGDEAYSQLIAYYGSDCLTGVPFTPVGENYYLYPVTPPGGYFDITEVEELGMISTYPLAGLYTLGEVDGGTTVAVPCLITGRVLSVRAQTCFPSPGIDAGCCPPTITESSCE